MSSMEFVRRISRDGKSASCVLAVGISLVLAFASGGGVNAQSRNVLVISSVSHAPLLQGDERPGNPPGLMTDIVRAAFKEQGIEVRYLHVPGARAAWSVMENKVAATVGSLDWFDDEQKLQIRSIEIYPADFRFFYLKNKFPDGLIYSNIDDLKNYKIGYQNGGSLTKFFKKNGFDVSYVNSLNQNTQKLFNGRIDLLVAETLGGWASIKKIYPDREGDFAMSDKSLLSTHGVIAFNKYNFNYADIFVKGMHEIKTNGVFDKILNSYSEYYFHK